MKKNKVIFAASFSAALIAALSFCTIRTQGAFVSAGTCSHDGHHYSAKAATCQEAGNKEFWACCKCHTQFTSEPATGTWSAAEELTETLESTHVAYVAPVACHYVPSTEVIGHYVCEWCGDEGTEIMTTDDVELGIGSYGSNSWAINPATSDATNNGIARAGAPLFDMNGEGGTVKQIVLPKINYSLYESVGFECGIDHYRSDSLECCLDLNGKELASWSLIKGTAVDNAYQYFIYVTANGNDLTVKFTNPGVAGASNSVTITDADIVSGVKSLALDPTSATGRTLYVNKVVLTEKCTNKFGASDLSKGSRSVLDVTDYSGTVGGVTSTFKKSELAESATGSYSKVELSYASTAYTTAVQNLAIRIYIESTDATSTLIFSDYVNTQYSSENPNWCIRNISVNNNTWHTISIPTARLAHDGNIDTVWFYSNGAKAARTYYVEFVSLYESVAPIKTVGFGSAISTKVNNCDGTGSNLGSHFSSSTISYASENHGYESDALRLKVGQYNTYLLDRIELLNPIHVGTPTSITFHLYLETAAAATGETSLILFGDNGVTNQQRTVTAAQHNTWIDVTFDEGSTDVIQKITNGLFDHFNFGIWGSSQLASYTDSLILASVSFGY